MRNATCGHNDLAAWEVLMVEHGQALMRVRTEAATRLVAHVVRAFGRIAAPDLTLAIHLETTASFDPLAYATSLAAARQTDARRGSASIGPHRDDLRITLNGYPVRATASQGQHRAIVLALKSAEIAVIAAIRGIRPILLLDDVSSELDPERTAAFFAFLAGETGQVFLTTTRRDLILTGDGQRCDFQIRSGVLEQVG
jgi:DNA replication and repair protein RecF